ncbi:MAG: hypothetical protein EA367_11370 [Leptolyngbya sp. DLM2.Bin15]|nr:MAG: hypothetical protein EA367_11370 [Leptolyngbya sp. DLM2.Bin15]
MTAGSAAMMLTGEAACAQTYQECVAGLVALGVSPDVAATQCSQQGGNSATCLDRLMYVNVQANSGPTEIGEWRFDVVQGPEDGSAMRSSGCRTVGFAGMGGWRCPNQTMRFQVMTAREAQAVCSGTELPATTTVILNRSGNVSTSGQVLNYSFTAQSGQRIRILVTPSSGSSLDPVASLRDPLGVIVADNDDRAPGDVSSEITFTIARSGQHQVLVEGYGAVSRGNFNLLIERF